MGYAKYLEDNIEIFNERIDAQNAFSDPKISSFCFNSNDRIKVQNELIQNTQSNEKNIF